MLTASRLEQWFRGRGWEVFPFQREVWQRMAAGESGLLHCSTGAGKTLAVWGGALLRDAARPKSQNHGAAGVRILWITPLRALAADTLRALREPLAELGTKICVEEWTGDTSAAKKAKLRRSPAEVLVITPESTSLLLSQPEFVPFFSSLHTVVVDEWHELLSTKRGVMTELVLARLRALAPELVVWGLSATLGNTQEAAETLAGWEGNLRRPVCIVSGGVKKQTVISSLLPPEDERYPWAGHLGLKLLPAVVEKLRACRSAIVFTNTRSQTELWFQALVDAMPDWADKLGIHHGSLAWEERRRAEEGLASGSLRAVVATSSLDLGVDFSPVGLVLQVGSPKGVARLLQRAGRSGHRPGAPSEICCVPTNSLELAEITAARNLAMRGEIEPRTPLRQPVDVLVQHVLTTAAGSGVQEREFLAEVRSTGAYHELSDAVWNWTLAFAAAGGKSLAAYETFRRLEREGETWRFRDRRLLLRHRLSIGTITADASVPVRFPTGGVLGSVEESFVARLRPGDRFLFAGRLLELVRFRDRQAIVRGAGSSRKAVGTPRWMGGKMPLSTCLGAEVRRVLDAAAEGIFPSPEMERLKPILEIQKMHSVVPKADEILIELLESREGHHAFIFPFEGRLVHEGLAALFAYRLARKQPRTFTFAINDYGFELLSNAPFPIEEFFADLLSQEHLEEDILGSINSGEMMRRRFREIARIAGLTFEGFPGRAARGRGRPMQVNSSLLYDVFRRYEPDHLLLEQARREVLEGQLEARRLREALRRMGGARAVFCHPPRPTPLAFPLMVERLREVLSTEALSDRLLRMQREMEEELAASPERRITAKAK